MRKHCIVLFLPAVFCSNISATPPDELEMLLTWGHLKVRPTASLSYLRQATSRSTLDSDHFVLSAARNEYESLQLVLQGPVDSVTGVRFHLGPGLGHVSQPDVGRVAYINVTRPTDCYSGGAGLWPELVVPHVDTIDGQLRNAFPFAVPKAQLRSVWADFFIPPQQQPGNFTASVDVLGSDGNVLGSESFAIEVFDATLPSTPTLRTLFGFWPLEGLLTAHNISQRCCNVCYFNKLCCCSNNTAAISIIKKYVRAALQNRVSLSALDVLMPGPREATASAWNEFFGVWGEYLSGLDLRSGLSNTSLTVAEVPTPHRIYGVGIDTYIVYIQSLHI